METNDEIFFEQLSAGKADASEIEEPYDVELAKASTGVLTTASRPRVIRAKAEEEKEEVAEEPWSDSEPEGQLTVDVYQTANDIVVESAIAGVKPENIDVNVTTDSISIRGSRKRDKSVKDEDYIYQECYWGRFARSIILPQEIEPDEAQVTFKNGILTVRLPKANKKKAKKLKINVE